MSASPGSLLDATETVPIDDARSVAIATNRLLEECFGAGSFDTDLLHASFASVGRLFAGEYPGYLECDMPYHDLRHSLDTALVTSRLIAGYQAQRQDSFAPLTPEHGLTGVLIALLHDTGYIRKASEEALCGPQLMREHEVRGVEFARRYLQTTSLAEYADLARLICATRMSMDFDAFFSGYDRAAIALGQMLGSADLICQISDRCYLERCYYHLYPELVIGGFDRVRTPDGDEQLLYCDGFDLVSKTPAFYEKIVRKRLEHDFQGVSRCLAVHFAGADPYAAAIRINMNRAARMVGENGSSLLGPEPITTTRSLASSYRPGALDRRVN